MKNIPGAIIFCAIVAVDGMLWFRAAQSVPPPSFAALDVGQGDATLIRFESGATLLVDAGPPGQATAAALEPLLARPRIDLVLITHPQLDHFGGLMRVLERYHVGAVIVNGRLPDPGDPRNAWDAIVAELDRQDIPMLALRAGDRIQIGNDRIDILSPDATLFGSGELNDTGLVLRASLRDLTALLVADIGTSVERHLQETLPEETLRADILKVGHHGSKYSTSEAFLNAIRPRAALIEVGARNTYRHPTPETIERLRRAVGAHIFRTDLDGTIVLTHPAQDILRAETARGDILERQ